MPSKIYISVFGFKLIKIKRESELVSFVYFCGIPFFSIEKRDNNYKINLFIIYRSVKSVNKRISEYKKKIIEKKNIKSKERIKKRFRNGERINICLFASRPNMWNFDYLYKIFNNDKRFNVFIVIMPDPFWGIKTQADYIESTYQQLVDKGYNPIKGYDKTNNTYFDLRNNINPDILFYVDFWKPHFKDEFYVTNFMDKITCLTEYGYSVMQDEKTCAFELNNLVDLYFRHTDIHKCMAERLMKNKGKNVYITGSPKLDERFDITYSPKNIWKAQNHAKKKIIWAPHHSDKMPANMYQYNSFWELYDIMFEIAYMFEDKVQFVFRPHPILKTKIIDRFGEEWQQKYYERWDKLKNGQVYNGDFVDLFMTSDAMIMDSCSFRAEYTAFDKPLLITMTSTSRHKYNDFGNILHNVFYETKNNLKYDVIKFIEDVVISGKDTLSQKRHIFVEKYFSKINGKTASENIYDNIVTFLEN